LDAIAISNRFGLYVDYFRARKVCIERVRCVGFIGLCRCLNGDKAGDYAVVLITSKLRSVWGHEVGIVLAPSGCRPEVQP
jgi:hypothetical protein